MESQPTDSVLFAWQGGEPTLLGPPYFQRIVELQQKHAQGKRIENALQTNATLLDDCWGAFLAENNFLVGVSIDGPEDLHNAYRVKRNGSGSFNEVLRGIRILQKHGVQWNSLTCVNAINSKLPLKVYKFLKGIGARHMQFIPIVERRPNPAAQKLGLDLSTPPNLEKPEGDPEMMPWSVQPRDYGTFLTTIFDTWIRKDVGKTFVQIFEVSFAKWIDQPGGLCIFSETCGDAVALEHDGSIYSCDHYVYPEFKIGNVRDTPLSEMLNSDQQLNFGKDKSDTLPPKCHECAYVSPCNGGCPKPPVSSN
ncbi:MAG: anaerobic sulfatase maturase [Verrucomicrobiia bacterium]